MHIPFDYLAAVAEEIAAEPRLALCLGMAARLTLTAVGSLESLQAYLARADALAHESTIPLTEALDLEPMLKALGPTPERMKACLDAWAESRVALTAASCRKVSS